jgi:hypothetical protein
MTLDAIGFINRASVIEDLEHDCNANSEIRERIKGKGSAYALQCQLCGRAIGGEVSKKNVSYKPEPFNVEVDGIYWEKYKSFSKKMSGNKIALLEPRRLAHNVLDENLDHSLSDILLEFPNVDLKKLIRRYVAKKRISYTRDLESHWKTEEELKYWFKNNFSEWFYILEEVAGGGFVNRENKSVRIDFVLVAKPLLIESGFTANPIGIEVKYLDPRPDHNFLTKASRGIFQALSYAYAGTQWNINGEMKSLSGVLFFSNLSFYRERDALFDSYDTHYKSAWKSMWRLAHNANAGELVVNDRNASSMSWAMEFAGARYFSYVPSKGLVKGNENLIDKQRIGNCY